jgi:hypothetical protein
VMNGDKACLVSLSAAEPQAIFEPKTSNLMQIKGLERAVLNSRIFL